MTPKNPRRQAAQYRVMARGHRRLMPAVAMFWLVPAGVLVLSFVRDWHTLIEICSASAAGSGLITQAKMVSELLEYSRKAQELGESETRAGRTQGSGHA